MEDSNLVNKVQEGTSLEAEPHIPIEPTPEFKEVTQASSTKQTARNAKMGRPQRRSKRNNAAGQYASYQMQDLSISGNNV